jgi:mono/diheme cytochrome c family protein
MRIQNSEFRIQNSRHEFQIPNSHFLILSLALVLSMALSAQEAGKTVADGVYSGAQAARGAIVYDAECAGCHRADLSGGSGPALRDERFARVFAGKDLKTLFAKTATTMPRGAPGSLGDAVYLDVIAHLLNENGFPAGSRELTADVLDGIRVLPGRTKPLPPIGDFSYVEVVGCLTAGPDHTWMLTQGSEPVVAVPTASAPSPAATERPLGTQSIHLVDAMAYTPDDRRGQKVSIRGLLIKVPGDQRMTISSLETVSPACRE